MKHLIKRAGSLATNSGKTAYPALPLKIDTVNANVNIRVHNLEGINVSIKGPEKETQKIRVAHDEKMLLIKGELPRHSSRGSTVIIGNNIISSSNTVTINGVTVCGGGDVETTIAIDVPVGLPISLSTIAGETQVGNTQGPIQIFANLGSNFRIGHVAQAQLSVQGSGDIEVASVQGQVEANVQGSGDIEVEDGNIQFLQARVQGSGDIYFGGTAVNANLSVMGSGDIKVQAVINKPNKQVIGSGDIKIRQKG